MIFTHSSDGKETQYNGFHSLTTAKAIHDCHMLGVVWVDGGPEYWSLDNDLLAVNELKRYYKETESRKVTVAIYNRQRRAT